MSGKDVCGSLPGLLTLLVVAIGLADRVSAETPQTAPTALIEVRKGDLPIILTAPHGGRTPIPDTPTRKGDGISRFVAVRDDNTAELTEALAKAIEKRLGARPYIILARFERKFADANRTAAEAYEHPNAKPHYDAFHAAVKEATSEVKVRWGRGLLIDVHGQATTPDGIYRGTRDGNAVRDLMKREGDAAVVGPKSVFGLLSAAGYLTLPEKPATGIGTETRYNGGYITDAYGSHRDTSIDAIQMEFGSTLRRKDRLNKTADDVAAAIEVFSKTYLPAAVQKPAK